jgi:hypothetical protein
MSPRSVVRPAPRRGRRSPGVGVHGAPLRMGRAADDGSSAAHAVARPRAGVVRHNSRRAPARDAQTTTAGSTAPRRLRSVSSAVDRTPGHGDRTRPTTSRGGGPRSASAVVRHNTRRGAPEPRTGRAWSSAARTVGPEPRPVGSLTPADRVRPPVPRAPARRATRLRHPARARAAPHGGTRHGRRAGRGRRRPVDAQAPRPDEAEPRAQLPADARLDGRGRRRAASRDLPPVGRARTGDAVQGGPERPTGDAPATLDDLAMLETAATPAQASDPVLVRSPGCPSSTCRHRRRSSGRGAAPGGCGR